MLPLGLYLCPCLLQSYRRNPLKARGLPAVHKSQLQAWHLMFWLDSMPLLPPPTTTTTTTHVQQTWWPASSTHRRGEEMKN